MSDRKAVIRLLAAERSNLSSRLEGLRKGERGGQVDHWWTNGGALVGMWWARGGHAVTQRGGVLVVWLDPRLGVQRHVVGARRRHMSGATVWRCVNGRRPYFRGEGSRGRPNGD